MTPWLIPALFSLFSFGLWGLFTKLTITAIDSKSALIFQTIGVVLAGIFVLFSIDFKLATTPKGVSFGVLTGIAYGLGCLFYFIAADKGKISTVVTLTALYPIVTIILSALLLGETIEIKQLFGILLALAAIFLLSA